MSSPSSGPVSNSTGGSSGDSGDSGGLDAVEFLVGIGIGFGAMIVVVGLIVGVYCAIRGRQVEQLDTDKGQATV